jgi:hypothetical protein
MSSKNGERPMTSFSPGHLSCWVKPSSREKMAPPPRFQGYHVRGFSYIKQPLDILCSFIFYFLWSERCRKHFDNQYLINDGAGASLPFSGFSLYGVAPQQWRSVALQLCGTEGSPFWPQKENFGAWEREGEWQTTTSVQTEGADTGAVGQEMGRDNCDDPLPTT